MTLRECLTALRHRWPVVLAVTLVAAALMWIITPATTSATPRAGTYTGTATLLVGGGDPKSQTTVSMGRIALYMSTGEIPRLTAAQLKYDGDPAVLASKVTITPDMEAMAITVSALDSDGAKAASVANAFADQTVEFFKTARPGTGKLDVTVLQKATPIPNAVGGGMIVPPSRTVRTALATLLGLLLGIGLALLLERMDSRLRTREGIHDALGMPIIAEVPKLGRAQRTPGTITVVDAPLSPYSDGYRAARTTLMHTPIESSLAGPEGTDGAATDGARLVLVTSAHPAEGKTTSVANLAASFAETGQRVLVLDADLRSPNLHKQFDVPQGAGISDYLSDHADTTLEALVRPTNLPEVQLITAGTVLAHPASLTSRMGALLTEARSMADVVLIDTAPLLAASDVFDLLPLVDQVILVVRNGRLTNSAGRRVAELVGRFHVPVTGVVIIGASTARGEYGYGYGYGYGAPKKKRGSRAREDAPKRASRGSSSSAKSTRTSPSDKADAEKRRARRETSSR